MYVCLDDGVGLDVHKISSAVRFHSKGEVHVWIDVPEHFAKGASASVFITKGCIAGSLDVRSILGKLVGDVAMEEGMGGDFFGGVRISGRRDLGKLGGRKAANGLVGHYLHPCYCLRVIEVEEGTWSCGDGKSFEFESWNK